MAVSAEPLHERAPGAAEPATADLFDAGVPLLFEFEPARQGGVDALSLRAEKGAHALVVWRPTPIADEWLRKGRNIFIAFDAAADFGPVGRAGATC